MTPNLLDAPANPRLALILALLGSLCLSFYLWHDNFRAQWGPIDDHEIIANLGESGAVPLSDVYRRWTYTEAFQPGRSLRYRPVYFLLRLLETSTWGADPHAWYTARFVMFALSLAIFWWLSARALGLLTGSAFVLWTLSAPFWPGLWACLGPSETYACFATALGALGFVRIVQSPAPGLLYKSSWLLVAFALIVSAGVKENFVLYALPVAWLLWRESRARRIALPLQILAVASIAFCLYIAGAVALAVSAGGKDIYANPVAPGARIAALANGILQAPILAAAVALSVAAALLYKGPHQPVLRRFAVIQILLYAAHAALVVFYNGGWPGGSRYAFPGALLSLFAVIFVPLFFLVRHHPLAPRISFCAALALFTLSALRGFHISKDAARFNANRTVAFTNAISRVESAVRGNPAKPVVLWSHSLEDFEAIYAVKAFLRARGLPNPIVLTTPDPYPPGGHAPALAVELLKNIASIKAGENGFANANLLANAPSCVLLGLAQDPPPSPCERAGWTY
jgi:hypothetical protein